MIPEGQYNAKPIEAAMGFTKSRSEQVAVSFELIDEPYQGTQITWYGYFSNKTMDRTFDSLRACGWDGQSLANLSTVGTKNVKVVIEHEADQDGNPRERIRWVNESGGVAMKNRMTPEQASEFDARMRAIMSGAPPQQQRANGRGRKDYFGPDANSDDLPY